MKKLPSPFVMGMVEEILSSLSKIEQANAAVKLDYYNFHKIAKMRLFLTPRELAIAFQVSIKTLERCRKSGSGPPYLKIGNKHIRYPLAGLSEWVKQAAADATAQAAE